MRGRRGGVRPARPGSRGATRAVPGPRNPLCRHARPGWLVSTSSHLTQRLESASHSLPGRDRLTPAQRLEPRGLNPLESARFGNFEVSQADLVFADSDGVVFIPSQQTEEILSTALSIWQTERRQAEAIQSGEKLREQLRFDAYLDRRATDSTYTFRQHLRTLDRAIEE